MSEHMKSPPSASRRSAGRGDSLLLPACGSDMDAWHPARWVGGTGGQHAGTVNNLDGQWDACSAATPVQRKLGQ